jgi:intein/homing endonuclease
MKDSREIFEKLDEISNSLQSMYLIMDVLVEKVNQKKKSKWIKWNACEHEENEMPNIKEDQLVTVKLEDGSKLKEYAAYLDWYDSDNHLNITAYKVN